MALFNHAVTWLRKNRALLPGVSVLARQVSEARTAAERRLYEAVARAAHRADPALASALAGLLVVPEGKRVSELERLRTPPVKSTGTAMVRAMERVEEISAFALGRVILSRVPVNRLSTLARYGQLSKAQTILRAPKPRRTALLTAVVRQLEAQAVDDALDLFAVLMANRLISPARRASERERLAMLPQLEKAPRILAKASKILTEELDLVAEHDADLDVAALWAALEEAMPRMAVAGAVATVEALVPEDDGSAEAAMREKLGLRYNTVRPFLSLLGESEALDAGPAGRRILKAVRRLPALSRRRVKDRPLLPREVDADLVPAMWRRAVFSNAKLPQGAVDRDAYVVCVLEQLHRALNRRDVFAAPSNRWADPRARLLDFLRWEAMRPDVLAGLSLTEDATEYLAQLTRGLDAAWRQMADRLEEAGADAKVEIVVPEGAGRARLSVDKLGAVGEPESLTWLKATTGVMLPRIDLPDLLFEVHSWTGFLDSFGHVSDRRTRMEGLLVSLVALLVSQSCNIGLTPVIDPTNKALTRSRLSHVDQNYVRADTIAAANAALIGAQSRIELAQMWGGGLLASVDGLRFFVPVRSINTGPSPKYHGYKRGVTWLNAVNDQVAGIGAMVVRGTPRDSLCTLDTLLNLDGGVKPEMAATDNASYSDMAFGLYKMLGFRFAPRFRDLADQRFWRADLPEGEGPAAGYGPLGRGLQQGQLQEDRHALAGHAAGGRVAHHQPGAGLRPAADVRPRGAPDPAGGGVRRVRADRQDHAPARPGRPGGRHLPAPDEPAAHRAGVPPPAGPRDLPRRPGPDPPGVPRGPGGPARRRRPGPQRRRPVEHPLPRRCRRPTPRRGPRHQGRGRRPPLPAQGPAHQLALFETGDRVFGGFGVVITVLAVIGLITSAAQNFYGSSLTILSAVDSVRPIKATVTKRLVALIAAGVIAVFIAANANDSPVVLSRTPRQFGPSIGRSTA